MSKLSPAARQRDPVNLPQRSAWSKGSPNISSAATSSSSPSVASSAATAATDNGPHSMRGSVAVSMRQQGASTVVQPVLGSASKDVQFGSIDDNSPPPSLSPAAPSTLMDQKQVRTFGRISATPKPPTASTLPTVTKPVVSLSGPSPTAASSAGPTVKKINIHKLFQQPSGASSDPIPRQVPHSMGEQSMPARMMQWQSRYYPIQTLMQLHPVPLTPSQSQVPISPLMDTPTITGSCLQSNAPPGRPTSGCGRKRDSLHPESLQTTKNRWTSSRGRHTVDEKSVEYVDLKVRSLFNKLTPEKFKSISRQILEWANRSVNETDGHTLNQVIKVVFEAATDETTLSEMYARLCRFLMERVSPDVRDDSKRNNQDGKPIAGGNLFRKYLLDLCQEDFERGWSVKETTNAAAARKAEQDKAPADAAKKAGGGGEEVLSFDEYYAAQKAKRRGLGLVKFIGELCKLQMLTERTTHECIKKLLSSVENPEEEIESLCTLLVTVGQTLDTAKARNHMDIYFSRMKELTHSGKINARIQFMILDVIELRTRNWVARKQVSAPMTIAEVHEKAARDRAVQERQALLRQTSMRDTGRGRRDTGRSDYGPPQVGADGWTTSVTRPLRTKPDDLSKFGNIERTNISAGLQFGPTSVFSKRGDKRESASVTRVSASSNLFAMLNSSEATPDAVSVGSSIDTSSGTTSPIDGPQRRRLILQPRIIPLGGEGSIKESPPSTAATSDYGEEETTSNVGAVAPSMTLERAKHKINEDVKEFFTLKDLNEGESYFESLPLDFRNELIETLFHKAIDAKESETQLVIELFGCAASKGLATESQFEKGFEYDMEFLEDISVDAPQVYTVVAKLMHAAKLSESVVERLADKIAVERDLAVKPKNKLLKIYASLA